MKILFSIPFSFKIADLAENVRLEGPEKQAMVSSSGPKEQVISLLWRAKEKGNKSPVAKASNSNCSCSESSDQAFFFGLLQETYCLFFWPATGDFCLFFWPL